MKYNIYCKFTHKLLAVYTNKATLEKLDLNRCYYVEVHPAKKEKNKELPKSESNRHSNDNHASNNDSMNILNPISPITNQQIVISIAMLDAILIMAQANIVATHVAQAIPALAVAHHVINKI